MKAQVKTPSRGFDEQPANISVEDAWVRWRIGKQTEAEAPVLGSTRCDRYDPDMILCASENSPRSGRLAPPSGKDGSAIRHWRSPHAIGAIRIETRSNRSIMTSVRSYGRRALTTHL